MSIPVPLSTLKITLPRPDKGLAVMAAHSQGMKLDEWAARWISHAARTELDTRQTLDEWLDVVDAAGNTYALRTRFPRVLVDMDGQIVARMDPMNDQQEADALGAASAFIQSLPFS
jgi:hypothetical protein